MCVYAARAEISLPLTAVTAGGMDRPSLISTRTKAESPKIADITATYCKIKNKKQKTPLCVSISIKCEAFTSHPAQNTQL